MFLQFCKITLLVLAVGIIPACEKTPATADAPAGKPRGVRSEMLVTTEWLESRLDSPGVVVVHVERTREGYEAAHIPGARFSAGAMSAKPAMGC